MSRRRAIIVLGAITLIIIYAVASILSIQDWLYLHTSDGIAVHIIIDNRTQEIIGPFVISDSDSSTALHTDRINPLSVIDVYYEVPVARGENSITMTDHYGKQYVVVGYFENNLRGRVDIRVVCANAEGLSGKHRELRSYYFSIQWRPWGMNTCESTEFTNDFGVGP